MRLARGGAGRDGPAAGGKGSGEQFLARELFPQLEEDWLVIADRNFYCWKDWCAAAGTGAALLWRVKSDILLPVLELLPTDRTGRCWSARRSPGRNGRRCSRPPARGDLDQDQARDVRVIEYEVPDREGNGKDELIALVTTITDPRLAPAAVLARAYHQRWEHETGNSSSRRTCAAGEGTAIAVPGHGAPGDLGLPADPLRDQRLTCAAATAAGIDPDRVKLKRTVRVIPRAVGPAFPPDRARAILARVMADITTKKNLNSRRRHRTYPRVVK